MSNLETRRYFLGQCTGLSLGAMALDSLLAKVPMGLKRQGATIAQDILTFECRSSERFGLRLRVIEYGKMIKTVKQMCFNCRPSRTCGLHEP